MKASHGEKQTNPTQLWAHEPQRLTWQDIPKGTRVALNLVVPNSYPIGLEAHSIGGVSCLELETANHARQVRSWVVKENLQLSCY